MRPSADAEELQLALIIPDEIAERILVWLVQPDDFIGFIERKAHARHGGTRRSIRPGKTTQGDVVVNEMLSLYFEIKTLCPDPVSTDKFLELARLFLNGFRELGFGTEIELEGIVCNPRRDDPAVVAVGQDGEREILIRNEEE